MSVLRVGPIWRSVEGRAVKRTNQMQMYRLGNLNRLHELSAIKDPEARATTLRIARIYLDQFTEDPLNQTLIPRALDRAANLLANIKYAKANGTADSIVHASLLQFETSLEDDLTRLPTYLIEPVAAYSVDKLIECADSIFPGNVTKKLPDQVIRDVKDAGACLVYEQPTACGFHVYRAIEAMLRRYCEYFDAKGNGNGRDWGKSIEALRKVIDGAQPKKPNKRTVELLDRIKSVDRNPLVHPELNLDKHAALMAFDMCKTVVSFMVEDIISADRQGAQS
jgi:hypothetical protein